ncbi:MAG: hypothetical protein QG585_277 [Patescibacteria group bacterium]|jgi:putative NADPH-quinone reductase|nr:hypothetical protein [Patescibacteria group bacterium]
MKTLIVTAHPSSTGFTHAIAGVIKTEREKSGVEVEILDLYKTDLKQDFLRFENIRELPSDPVKDAIQAKITEADELVFVHPVWWVSMPAIMKNFLDQNFTSRFAYRYIDGKRIGLLKGKTARVYVTCDMPIWLYALLGFPFVPTWVVGVLVYCGIDVRNFSIFRMLGHKTPEGLQKHLDRVKRDINKKRLWLSVINFLGSRFQ